MNADIEVVFHFNDNRKLFEGYRLFHFNDNRKLFEGYRPAHLIDGYNLTTGVHHYYKADASAPEIKGTITFVAPEYYPNCLRKGKRVDMYEGGKKIGYVEVLKIINPVLDDSGTD